METDKQAKLRALLLYCISKCEDDTYFSKTKLFKYSFFSDIVAYQWWGNSITGVDYLAMDYGPVPDGGLSILDKLVADRDVALVKRPMQQRYVAYAEPELSLFTSEEIALVDKVIDLLRKEDAEATSELSHGFLGWKAARKRAEQTGKIEKIRYGTINVSNRPLDEFEEERILELARKHEWPI